MAIQITCTGCGFAFRVRDEFAGKTGKCPRCQALFRAPSVAPPGLGAPPVDPAMQSTVGSSSQLNLAQAALPPNPGSNSGAKWAAPIQREPAAQQLPPPIAAGAPPQAAVAPQVTGAPQVTTAPQATTSAGGFPIVTTQPAPRTGAAAASSVSGKKKAAGIPPWVWATVAGVALIVGGGVWYLVSRDGTGPTRPQPAPVAVGPRVDGNPAPFRPEEPPEEDPAPVAPPPADASLEDVVAYVERGVVLIVASDALSEGLGTGFVIDLQRKLVATNYHVMRQALKADVKFEDGTRFGILGYVAVKPDSDLAIVQVNGLPEGARELQFAPQIPRKASEVFALGNPHGYEFIFTQGRVSALNKAAELPPDAQAFLESGQTNAAENLWIAHDAEISPGNSGGPLVDSAGRVVGINTWKNQAININFALDAQILKKLYDSARDRSVQPLEAYYKPLVDESTIAAAPSGPPPGAPVVPAAEPQDFSAEVILSLLAAAQGPDGQWSVAGPNDYTTLADLAREVAEYQTFAQQAAAGTALAPEQKQALDAAVQQVVKAIGGFSWDAVRHQMPINTQAQSAGLPPGSGVFVLAKVAQAANVGESGQGLVLQIGGSQDYLFVLMPPGAQPPAQGAACILLGYVTDQSVELRSNNAPPMQMQIIVSNAVTPITLKE